MQSSVKRSISFLLILGLAGGVSPAGGVSLRQKLSKSLSLTGAKTYGLRSVKVSGNEDLFRSQNYELTTDSVNDTSLTLTGKLFRGTTMTATVTDNRWNPPEGVYTLFYEGNRTKLGLGDVTASISGNQFFGFNKRLRGVTVNQKMGTATFTAIASRTKSAAEMAQIRGNNTPGPYQLGYSQIVDGSEHVRIDDREIPRTDSSGRSNYMLDTVLGTLTFRDGLTVPETSTITVSLETNSRYNAAGTVWGLRGDVPVTKKLGFGVTYLAQSPERSTGAPLDTDWFGGRGPEYRYFLQFRPALGGQMNVRVDGVLKINGVDFVVDYNQGYIQFSLPIPNTSTIEVAYTPLHANSVSTARTILGFDSSYRPSDKLGFTYQFARSDVDASGLNPGGNAMALVATVRSDKLTLRAGLKNVDQNYCALDTAGLGRTEKGADLDARYQLRDGLSVFTRLGKFRRPLYSGTGLQLSTSYYTAMTSEFGFNFKKDKLPQIDFTHSRYSSGGSASADDFMSMGNPSYDSLAVRWDRGKISMDSELRSDSYRSIYSLSQNPSNTRANTARFGLEYRPGERFYVRTDLSGSKIYDKTLGNTTAQNAQISANFQPMRSLFISGSLRMADSGRPYLERIDGYGSSGGQYNGGATTYFNKTIGGRSLTRALNVQFTPTERISFDTNLSYTYGEGDSLSNTGQTSSDFGLTLTPFDYLSLSGRYSLQDMYYVGNTGGMSTKMKYLDARLGPLAQFTLKVSYQDMISDGASTIDLNALPQYFVYDFNSLVAELSHPLGSGRTAFVRHETSANSGGGLGLGAESDSRTINSAGVDFALSKTVSLRADWRVISGQGDGASNRYKASIPNLELRAQF